MKRLQFRQIIGAFLLVSFLAFMFSQPFQKYISIPTKLILFEGQHASFEKSQFLGAEVVSAGKNVSINEQDTSIDIQASKNGSETMECFFHKKSYLKDNFYSFHIVFNVISLLKHLFDMLLS